MPGPALPQHSGKEFYNPGGTDGEYDKIQNQPELPGVPPPSGAVTGAPPPISAVPSGPIDPNAPDVLELIAGGTFKTPFTVTLMKRSGVQTFKSDAGTKTETAFELCKETIRTPSDLMKLISGIKSEIYKSLNNMTVEFQLMMYLAREHGILEVPPKPAEKPSKKPEEAATEA